MRVSTRSCSLETISTELRETLDRLRLAVNLSHEQWADILRLTPTEYQRVASGRKPLLLPSLLAISERFDLSVDLIMQNRVDYRAIGEHHSGNLAYISDRYTIAAFSKRRTALNFLNYVEGLYGWRLRNRVLRNFQMSEAVFANADAPINVQFLTDLMGFLRKNGFSDADFFAAGTHSLFTNQNSLLGEALRPMKTTAQVYEHMTVDLISFFERNCTYTLTDLDESSCVLESRSNRDVAEALRVRHLGSVDGCLQKAGILASAPGYIDLPYAHVNESSCVHRGDDVCRFEVNFEKANWRGRHSAPSLVH